MAIQGYRFGEFEVDLDQARLLRDGKPVILEPKAFDVLRYFLENRSRLVSKEEILDAVWPETAITLNAMSRAVARLRKALGDSAREPRFIETSYTRGYRWIAPTTEITAVPSSPPTSTGETPGPNSRRALALQAGAAALIVFALAWLGVALWGPRAVESDADQQRLAVLPIKSIGDDPRDEHFADGLTEQLVAVLARLSEVEVLSSTSSMAFKGDDARAREIARELNANALLEGSVHREGDQRRILIRLVDGEREVPLWTRSFDGPASDVLDFQHRIAEQIADALKISLSPHLFGLLEQSETSRPEALNLFLRGLGHYRSRTRLGNENALRLFGEALKIDPDFALAEAGLANSYAMRGIRWSGGDRDIDAAEDAAQRALTISPDLAMAHKAMGIVHSSRGELGKSLAANRRALELAPFFDEARYNAASVSHLLGEWDEAVRLLSAVSGEPAMSGALATYLLELDFPELAQGYIEEVEKAEPVSGYLDMYLARREALAGQYPEAEARMAPLRHAFPSWPRVWRSSGEVAFLTGHDSQAFEFFTHAKDLLGSEDYPEVDLPMALILRRQGDIDRSAEMLEQLALWARGKIAEEQESWEGAWTLAAVEATRGNHSQALEWLEKAYEKGRRDYRSELSNPAFEALRDDPRFQQIIARMRADVAAMRLRVEESIARGDIRIDS
ncbi:MAG: winged helix-turn-helix domain-containing protein [Acidobacteriota bacterium]